MFALLWSLLVPGLTPMAPPNQASDDIAMLRRTFTQAKSLEATLLVRRPGEAALPVKIVLAKPDRLWVQVAGAVTRGNGQVVEQVGKDGKPQSAIPSTPSAVLAALGTDYLRMFRLFFQTDVNNLPKLVQQVDEVRGSTTFKVFDFSEKDRPGSSARLFVDPRDWLPREIALTSPTSDLTRVLVSSIAVDTDVSGVDFGANQQATNADASTRLERKIRLEEFYLPHISSYPLGTTLVIAGAFPASLSKVRSATLNIVVDGSVYSSQSINGDWVAKWTPQSPDTKKYKVRLEAIQGTDKITIAEREIEIKKHWSLSPKSLVIGDDGLAVLEPGEPLEQGWDKLKFQWNGHDVKAWVDNGRLVMEGTRLLPGLVSVTGQLQRADGTTFPVEPVRMPVKPVFSIKVPISDCKVTLTNADEKVAIGMDRTLAGVTGWRVWLNGVDVQDGAGATPSEPTLDWLIPGKNELVLELIKGRTSFFSQAHAIAAEVDIAVQRRQVAETLLRIYREPLKYRMAVLLKLQDQLSPDLADPNLILPSVREFMRGSQMIKEHPYTTSPRFALTPDHTFNDQAKTAAANLRDVMDYCARNAELLNFAYGYGNQVKSGGRLEDSLRAMLHALDNSRGATDSAKNSVKAINTFFKEHGRAKTEPFGSEATSLNLTGEGSRVTHYHRLLLQACIMIAAGTDDDSALVSARSFVERLSDAPYRDSLLGAIKFLREVIPTKRKLAQVLEEIRIRERALAKATSSEERRGIADGIAKLREQAERLYDSIAELQARAWENVERAASTIHVNFNGAYEKAPK